MQFFCLPPIMCNITRGYCILYVSRASKSYNDHWAMYIIYNDQKIKKKSMIIHKIRIFKLIGWKLTKTYRYIGKVLHISKLIESRVIKNTIKKLSCVFWSKYFSMLCYPLTIILKKYCRGSCKSKRDQIVFLKRIFIRCQAMLFLSS